VIGVDDEIRRHLCLLLRRNERRVWQAIRVGRALHTSVLSNESSPDGLQGTDCCKDCCDMGSAFLRIVFLCGTLEVVAGAEGSLVKRTHPLTDIPQPLPCVSSTFWMRDRSPANHLRNSDAATGARAFTAGKKVELLAGVHNGCAITLSIHALMGSLNSPTDFALHVQNFSLFIPPGSAVRVPPNSEVTIPYDFVPDKHLQPRDFQVAVSVFYVEEDSMNSRYATTFYNETIEVAEALLVIDGETLSVYFMLSALCVALVLLGFQGLKNAGVIQKAKRTTSATLAEPVKKDMLTTGEEWLKDTAFKIKLSKQRAAPRRARRN